MSGYPPADLADMNDEYDSDDLDLDDDYDLDSEEEDYAGNFGGQFGAPPPVFAATKDLEQLIKEDDAAAKEQRSPSYWLTFFHDAFNVEDRLDAITMKEKNQYVENISIMKTPFRYSIVSKGGSSSQQGFQEFLCEWFVDAYRMRCHDDYTLGMKNAHGLYQIIKMHKLMSHGSTMSNSNADPIIKNWTSGDKFNEFTDIKLSLMEDFFFFVRCARKSGTLPFDISSNDITSNSFKSVSIEVEVLLAAATRLLPKIFTKKDAIQKYGYEHQFSHPEPSLRRVAEYSYACSVRPELQQQFMEHNSMMRGRPVTLKNADFEDRLPLEYGQMQVHGVTCLWKDNGWPGKPSMGIRNVPLDAERRDYKKGMFRNEGIGTWEQWHQAALKMDLSGLLDEIKRREGDCEKGELIKQEPFEAEYTKKNPFLDFEMNKHRFKMCAGHFKGIDDDEDEKDESAGKSVNVNSCSHCGKTKVEKRFTCPNCKKQFWICNQECQKLVWKVHKTKCIKRS